MADGLLLAEENSFWFREMSSHNPKMPTSSNSAPFELLEDIAFELYVTKIVPNFISLFQSNSSIGDDGYMGNGAALVNNIVIDEGEGKRIVKLKPGSQATQGSSRCLPPRLRGTEVSFETPYSISQLIIDQIIDGMFKCGCITARACDCV